MKLRLMSLLCVVLAASPASAEEPGALTTPFRKSLVTRMVDLIYATAGAEDALRISDSAKDRAAAFDTDKNGSLSRAELSEAILNAKLRLSLKDKTMAQKVVVFVDGEDGIVGGQVRVNAGMIESKVAAKNLEEGTWTVGAGLFTKVDGAPVLGIRQGARGAELVLP